MAGQYYATKQAKERWFTPFGTTPSGLLAADAVKTSASLAPLFLLIGYLHRTWGAGSSTEQTKSESAIKHHVSINPGYKEAEDPAPVVRRTLSSEAMASSLPVLTAGAMYLMGVKLADKKRKIIDSRVTKDKLRQVENDYNQVLRSRLYPEPEVQPEPEAQPEAQPVTEPTPAELAWEAYHKVADDTIPATPAAPVTPVRPKSKAVGNFTKGLATADQNLAHLPGIGVLSTGAIGVFLLSYAMAKKWSDANDPVRRRAKDIKDAVEKRAVHRWTPKLVIDDQALQKNLARDHQARIDL